MAGSVNKVFLIGNLGKDPEIRSLQDGTRLANFTMATSETWNDRTSGERKERTEWHRVVVYNDRLADFIEKYVKKGAKVCVEGSLQTRKWTDQSGQDKYTTEVVIGRFKGELTLLDGRSGGDAGNPDGGYQPRERTPQRAGGDRGGERGADRGDRPMRGGTGPSWDAPKPGDLDDEIPF